MLIDCDTCCGAASGASGLSSGCTDASWDDVKVGLEPPGVLAGASGLGVVASKLLGSLESEDGSVGALTNAAAEADEPVSADAASSVKLVGLNFWGVLAGRLLSCLPVSLPEADACCACGCAALLAASCMLAAGGGEGFCCRAAASD